MAAGLDAYGTAQELAREPRYDTPVLAQAAADERAFALARRGYEVLRRPDGSWVVGHWRGDPHVCRIVVFEAREPQTVFPEPLGQAAPRCPVYRPGHTVHYIQARLARQEGGEGVPAEVAELIEPDVVILAFGTARRRFHNHDLQRLRDAIEAVGPQAHAYEGKSFLRLRTRAFSIATPEQWEPGCGSGPTHGFLTRP